MYFYMYYIIWRFFCLILYSYFSSYVLISFQISKSKLNIDLAFKHGRPLSKIPSLGRRNFQFPRQSKFFKLPNIKQVIGQLCGTGKVFSNQKDHRKHWKVSYTCRKRRWREGSQSGVDWPQPTAAAARLYRVPHSKVYKIILFNWVHTSYIFTFSDILGHTWTWDRDMPQPFAKCPLALST